jgi:hypothetical protein
MVRPVVVLMLGLGREHHLRTCRRLIPRLEVLPLTIIEAIQEREEQVSEITQVETWGETLILTHQ